MKVRRVSIAARRYTRQNLYATLGGVFTVPPDLA